MFFFCFPLCNEGSGWAGIEYDHCINLACFWRKTRETFVWNNKTSKREQQSAFRPKCVYTTVSLPILRFQLHPRRYIAYNVFVSPPRQSQHIDIGLKRGKLQEISNDDTFSWIQKKKKKKVN